MQEPERRELTGNEYATLKHQMGNALIAAHDKGRLRVDLPLHAGTERLIENVIRHLNIDAPAEKGAEKPESGSKSAEQMENDPGVVRALEAWRLRRITGTEYGAVMQAIDSELIEARHIGYGRAGISQAPNVTERLAGTILRILSLYPPAEEAPEKQESGMAGAKKT